MINKKLNLLFGLILCLCLSLFVSCGDDDNNDTIIDSEWKLFNDSLFKAHADSLIKNGGEYTKLECLTRNGHVYFKRSSDIEPATPEMDYSAIGPKVSADGNPQYTDSVVVRYTGWYYTKNTEGKLKRITFDGTEGEFNKASAGFAVSGVASGFGTMLQYMNIKDLNQVQVVIPYQLAYGESGKGNIPGYTTLYFNILLQEIIPLNPDEAKDNEVDLGGVK